jgi:serine phosphatase RsbU (regulator of sigma subunit)
VALTLQQSLLPDRLPRVAGFDLATRYVPASEVVEIGGDFYELSRLDGQLVVAVGDLGVRSAPATERLFDLPPGASLVLYTDGLVERRGDSVDDGIARLMRAAARPETDLDAYCDGCCNRSARLSPATTSRSSPYAATDRVGLTGKVRR